MLRCFFSLRQTFFFSSYFVDSLTLNCSIDESSCIIPFSFLSSSSLSLAILISLSIGVSFSILIIKFKTKLFLIYNKID